MDQDSEGVFFAIAEDIHHMSHVVDMCSYVNPKGLLSLIRIGISHCRDSDAAFRQLHVIFDDCCINNYKDKSSLFE